MGREEYQNKIAGIKKSKLAYEALEKGQKALADGDTAKALKFAREAIRIEPREALFYELKADVQSQKKHYKEALKHFNDTIQKNNKFFRFFLKRGLLKEKLGDASGARNDLQKSNSLLPTAIAHKALGNFALASGQRRVAVEHFRIAATSGSEIGKNAGMSLARLELPQKPSKYITVQKTINRNGYVIISIRNKSPVTIANVAVAVTLMGRGGKVRAEEIAYFPSPVPSGRRSVRVTHIGPLKKEKQLPRIKTRIIRAGVVK